MRELALFAGAGGGILGGLLLRWRTVCAVEIDSYCRSILLARQRDGILPHFPIWNDVRTFDGQAWRGHVDVISGGFPCQDISPAGTRAGINGERSGLWREFARIIGEVEPAHVFIENSAHLRTHGLVTVLQDLARMGFNARWGVLGACCVGAPHVRKRMWIVAHATRVGRKPRRTRRPIAGMARQHKLSFYAADTDGKTLWKQPRRFDGQGWQDSAVARINNWWPVDTIQGMDDGMAHRVDKVRATGDGQVPRVAALAWEALR